MSVNKGISGTRTYRCWIDMNRRCKNPKDVSYYNYGGRGIKVCKRWNKFINFLGDMGERPTSMSLERKNNSQGYSPANCKWATRKEQNSNRRNERCLVTFNGKTQNIAEWSRELGINRYTLWSRIKVSKWSIEKALTHGT